MNPKDHDGLFARSPKGFVHGCTKQKAPRERLLHLTFEF